MVSSGCELLCMLHQSMAGRRHMLEHVGLRHSCKGRAETHAFTPAANHVTEALAAPHCVLLCSGGRQRGAPYPGAALAPAWGLPDWRPGATYPPTAVLFRQACNTFACCPKARSPGDACVAAPQPNLWGGQVLPQPLASCRLALAAVREAQRREQQPDAYLPTIEPREDYQLGVRNMVVRDSVVIEQAGLPCPLGVRQH